ncbi:hypothetical protein BCR36DRAFT_349145 [Piromyces finnis]|uniref:Uncharacterized protein n=1 Tax=Piromyces finnis TaxID=1754191 RepID=A0A1Y1VF10_9FUNG|nr:hypothetical protein BCR36DRAFT_349145 [Piromyces finnis]|eukprot:ORX53325.1 hypothetical protein BCR36DRAFT_349145 [Piromyces finnis]
MNINKNIDDSSCENGTTSAVQNETIDQYILTSLNKTHSAHLCNDKSIVKPKIDFNKIHSISVNNEYTIQIQKSNKNEHSTLCINTAENAPHNNTNNTQINKSIMNNFCIPTTTTTTTNNNDDNANDRDKNKYNIDFKTSSYQNDLNYINSKSNKKNNKVLEFKKGDSTCNIKDTNSNDNIKQNNRHKDKNNKYLTERKINESKNECHHHPSPVLIPNNKGIHFKNLSQFDIENNNQARYIPPIKKEDLRILFTESYIPKSNSHHEFYKHFKNYKHNNKISNNKFHNFVNNDDDQSHHNYFNSKSMASYYNSSHGNNELNINKNNLSLNYTNHSILNSSTENKDNDKNSEINIYNLSEDVTPNDNQPNTLKHQSNSISSLTDKNYSSTTFSVVNELSQSMKNITSNQLNSFNYLNLKNSENLGKTLNKNYLLNNCSSNLNTTTLSITSQNNLESNKYKKKIKNVSITNVNDNSNDDIKFLNSNRSKNKITIFNYFDPNFCIKKEKIPFTINISYTSCSHPVKLIFSPSSDIEFLNEIPNEQTGLWTSKKSFHVLQPSLITVIQSSDSNKKIDSFQNKPNQYNVFNLGCSEGCHLNKVRSLSIDEDKKVYGNFLFNTSYSRIVLSSYKNSKESKAISLSNIKSEMNFTNSTILSNSYPLAHNKSPFSILTSAFSSFFSSSIIPLNESSNSSLDGIWIGTFGHHGLEFIYIKSLNENSNSSKKDPLITIHNDELPIIINSEEYSFDEEEPVQTSNHFYDMDAEISNIKNENKKLVAYKITGDVNIPKGEISWSAEINHPIDGEITTLEGRSYNITQSIEFQNAKIYKVEGIFAEIGYRNIKKQPGKLIVLSNNEIAIFWETLYKISRFKRYL